MEQVEQIEQTSGNIQTSVFTEDDKGFQSKKFFFTYHLQNGEQYEQAFINLEGLAGLCDKYIWSEEYGKSGETPHIQGAFILCCKMRATTLQKNFFVNGVSLMKLKNWGAAFKYCMKEGNKIYSSEKVPKQVKTISENELFNWQQELIELIKCVPHDRNILWYKGSQGCGKTSFMKYLVVHYGAVILSGSPSNMKNGIIDYMKNNNGCTPEIIVSNIGWDKDLNYVHYSGYEDIKDMTFYSGKYEGGMVCGNPPHLIIFSNGVPETENVKFIVRDIDNIVKNEILKILPS